MTSLSTSGNRHLCNLLTVASTVLVLIGLALGVRYFYSLVVLLGLVLVITYILLAPVNLMERGILLLARQTRRIPLYERLVSFSPEANPRMLAVLVVYFVFFMTLTIGMIRLVPVLSHQLSDFGSKVGVQIVEVSERLVDWADKAVGGGTLRTFFEKDINQARHQGVLPQDEAVEKPVTEAEKDVIQRTVLEGTINQLENFVASAPPSLMGLFTGTVNGFVYFLTGMLLTFYALVDGRKLKREVLQFLPTQARTTADYLSSSFHNVMFAFVKGQVMLGALTGLWMFIILSWQKVPYALLISVMFALAELLPVIGTYIGMAITIAVIVLNMPNWPLTVAITWGFSYGYQTVKDNILAPKVVGDVMGLHPLVILLALLIGAKVAGLLGILMALPVASAVNVILRLVLHKDAQAKAALMAAQDGNGETPEAPAHG